MNASTMNGCRSLLWLAANVIYPDLQIEAMIALVPSVAGLVCTVPGVS